MLNFDEYQNSTLGDIESFGVTKFTTDRVWRMRVRGKLRLNEGLLLN